VPGYKHRPGETIKLDPSSAVGGTQSSTEPSLHPASTRWRQTSQTIKLDT